MTAEDLDRLVAEIPPDLKALVDADQRTNREVVESALWREFGGERRGALERRIEEKRKRIGVIEQEKQNREEELRDERQELEALEEQLESKESRRQRIAREAVDVIGVEPSYGYDNDAAENWAEKAGMEPAAFWELYTEVFENVNDQ